MENTYKKAAGNNIILSGDKGWFISHYNQCLCEVDTKSRKGRVIKYLGYSNDTMAKYSGVVKYDNCLYLYPNGAEDIAIYDLNDDSMDTIRLETDNLGNRKIRETGKFVNAVVSDKSIFLLSHWYPAIVKLDVESKELTYISDWVDELEEKMNYNSWYGFFSEGYAIVEDKIYIPVGCEPDILELNTNSLTTRVIHIDCEVGGIAGLTDIGDGLFCLSCGGENGNRILLWNYKTETIAKEIEFPIKYEVPNPLRSVTRIGNKLYLMMSTWAVEDFYEYNLETRELKRNETLSALDYLYHGEYLGAMATMSVWVEDNRILHFANGKDFTWHEYDTATDHLESYNIYFEAEDEIYEQIYADKTKAYTLAGLALKEMDVSIGGFLKAVVCDKEP